VVYAALIGNVLVAASKFGAAAVSGSSAMLTEAIHSSADSVNQVLLLIGDKRSRKRADAMHPFGHGLEVYFWTFVVAVIVLLGGGAASVIEGIAHIRHPEAITAPWLSLGVLALSVVFEGTSLSVGYREYKRQVRRHNPRRRTVGLWTFIKLSKDPKLYESLLEDSAALIGIGFATIGVVASGFFHVPTADGWASVAIGVLLVGDSYAIAQATRSLIAGESVAPPILEEIKRKLATLEDRMQVTELKTLQLGPRAILVTLTVEAERGKSVNVLEEDSRVVTEALRSVDERIKHVYFRFAAEEKS
jgi:cation diffusion facilitator family transporter